MCSNGNIIVLRLGTYCYMFVHFKSNGPPCRESGSKVECQVHLEERIFLSYRQCTNGEFTKFSKSCPLILTGNDLLFFLILRCSKVMFGLPSFCCCVVWGYFNPVSQNSMLNLAFLHISELYEDGYESTIAEVKGRSVVIIHKIIKINNLSNMLYCDNSKNLRLDLWFQ